MGEATPVGVINMIGNGLGFVEIMILTPILNKREKKDSQIAMGILVLLQVLAFAMILLVKDEHKQK